MSDQINFASSITATAANQHIQQQQTHVNSSTTVETEAISEGSIPERVEPVEDTKNVNNENYNNIPKEQNIVAQKNAEKTEELGTYNSLNIEILPLEESVFDKISTAIDKLFYGENYTNAKQFEQETQEHAVANPANIKEYTKNSEANDLNSTKSSTKIDILG